MHKIFLSPSNQSDNAYAYGNTNEASVCAEIARFCQEILESKGFEVMLMQWETAQEKCKRANQWGADLYLPIHTNAYNKKVSGTRIFVYEKKGDSFQAAQAIFDALAPLTPGTSENIQAYPQLIELNQVKAPAVYIEAEFHDVKEIAKWLTENTKAVAQAICQGICAYFGQEETFTQNPAYLDTGKAGIYQVSTQQGLYFRLGADTGAKVLALLPFGERVCSLGHYIGPWLRVETKAHQVGYCHSDYLERVQKSE